MTERERVIVALVSGGRESMAMTIKQTLAYYQEQLQFDTKPCPCVEDFCLMTEETEGLTT